MKRFLSSIMFRGGTIALITLLNVAAATSAQTITTLDPPNSVQTVVEVINSSGQIAGYYQDSNGLQLGFLRQQDGTFTPFSGRTNISQIPTAVTGMNDSGEIIGYYYTTGHHAFLRQPDGTIIPFQGPSGATTLEAIAGEPAPTPCTIPNDNCFDGSIPYAINAVGQITGALGQGPSEAYLREPDGSGVWFRADPQPSANFTVPLAINLSGEIAGYYQDFQVSTWSGFLREPDGTIVKFDAPNASLTEPTSIDHKGHIAGHYATADGRYHGFLRKPNGKIETFDPVGSVHTEVMAINQKQQITGFFASADGIYHGFLRERNGRIESFDAPGARNAGTFPKDINDRGEIVGYYQDANFVLHGFVRSRR